MSPYRSKGMEVFYRTSSPVNGYTSRVFGQVCTGVLLILNLEQRQGILLL